MKKNILILVALLLTSIIFGIPSAQAANCKQVVFFKQDIICLKKGFGPMNVMERALLIEKRLEKISNDLTLAPADITLTPEGETLNMNLGDFYIMTLKEGDFEHPTNETFEGASDKVVISIKKALLDYRKENSPQTFIKGSIYTAIATLILIIVLASFSRLFPKLYKLIETKGKLIPSLKIQKWEILNSARVVQFVMWIARVSRTLLTILALYIYIPLVMTFFPMTAPMAPYIFSFIANPLKNIFQAIVDFIPNFFIILVIGFVTN